MTVLGTVGIADSSISLLPVVVMLASGDGGVNYHVGLWKDIATLYVPGPTFPAPT